MTPPRPTVDGESSAPAWTASTVARRLGVAPATLRSWSARYGIGPAGHRPGSYRHYTSLDVAELDTIRRLRGQGVPMATAATLARERRERSGHRPHDAYWDDAVTALLHAAGELDADAALDVLGRAFASAGTVDTWNRLCRPALGRTAVFAPATTVASGPVDLTAVTDADVECVDAECVLTWSIITSLRRRPPGPPVPAARRVLLACPAGELHTLALDALYAALDEAHVPARMLGPSVPAPALVHAAANLRPPAVFVWAQTPGTTDPELLTGLARYSDAVVAAGPGWDRADVPAGVLRPGSLTEAVATAERATAT